MRPQLSHEVPPTRQNGFPAPAPGSSTTTRCTSSTSTATSSTSTIRTTTTSTTSTPQPGAGYDSPRRTKAAVGATAAPPVPRPAAPASKQFIKTYFKRNFSFFSIRRKRLCVCAPKPAHLLRSAPVRTRQPRPRCASLAVPGPTPGPGAPRDGLAASSLPPDEAGQGPPVLPAPGSGPPRALTAASPCSGAGAGRYGCPKGVPAPAPGRSGGR